MNIQKIKNIKDGWINLIRSKIPNHLPDVVKEMAQERINICQDCMHLKRSVKNRYICCLCGCSFPAIVYAPKKRCPDGKW